MKTLSSVCMLTAQHHKDIKCFQQMNNTQEVLNVKVRLKFSIGQSLSIVCPD